MTPSMAAFSLAACAGSDVAAPAPAVLSLAKASDDRGAQANRVAAPAMR